MAFDVLVDKFKQDIEKIGATVIDDGDPDVKPARIRIVSGGQTVNCLLFLWNITPGGNHRPEHERRIQVTSAKKFPLVFGARTIIGGWHEETGVWMFWDVMSHTKFSTKSPSFQAHERTLLRAMHQGLATQVKTRKSKKGTKPPETVVAVLPENLLWYVQEGDKMHNARSDAADVGQLLDATPEVERLFLDESASIDQCERRYSVIECLRAFRDAKFKPAVLRAYRFKCAVCGVALKLVDAAHIVPVKHPKSIDIVTNGLGLCRLHHAAYDNALIGIRPDHMIIVNKDALTRLVDLDLHHGFDQFRDALPDRIVVPSSIEVRPDPNFLLLGMQVRRWPESLIR